MARPKKRRGYSPIVVDGEHLAWRVSSEHNVDYGFVSLTVRSDSNAGCRLVVDFGGVDVWLNPQLGRVPTIVKPAFVAQAVQFARAKGWDPIAHQDPFRIRWTGGQFVVTANPEVTIRPEQPGDEEAIRAVNAAAFETPAEACLVDSLREASVHPFLSMVAVVDSRIVGHILFSPVQVVGKSTWGAVGLGPMAVLPDFQNGGVGSQLVNAGLDACRAAGHQVIVVLGHPNYYPRFGFKRMSEFGLTCEFEVPDEVLMVAELTPGAIAGRTGEVRYHPLFKNV
ncbi:MAG: N-acetyltransferase [Planctomycetes bacterium]|nr:N-acetyltransferase [Planctomycetota bacterium]